MSFLLSFLHSQLFVSLPYPNYDFSGQTIIVTGSNVGLGLEAARHCARLNASKVILGVRNVEQGNDAKTSIENSTKRRGVVEVWHLDLSSYQSVKDFMERAQDLQRLDAVIENAGIAGNPEFAMPEGNEATITINVISTFLLALMILPKLRESATKFNVEPHLVIVSSEVHAFPKFEERHSSGFLKKLNDKASTNMAERYPLSKLLEVFYTRELATRTATRKDSSVIINYLNPGLCHSKLSRNGSFTLDIMKFFLARSTEQGSRTLVHAAAKGRETHGAYLSDCQVAKPAMMVQNEPYTQQLVWDEISEKLESIQPGILGNI